MRQLLQLYKEVQQEDFSKAYPLYKEKGTKVNVLYVAPFLNGTGYYRMLLPLLELNQTTTHRAIVTDIRKWNFAKEFDDYISPIDPDLIIWADYLVFPTLFTDITTPYPDMDKSLIELIKSYNKNVVLVMDIDSNIHEFSELHPAFDALKYSLEKRKKTY